MNPQKTPRELVYGILDEEFGAITSSEQDTMDELGMDSLDLVEMVTQLEDGTDRDLGIDHGIDSTTTVGDLIRLVTSIKEAKDG